MKEVVPMKKPRGYKELCRRILEKKNVVGAGLGYKEVKTRSTDEISVVVLVNKKEPIGKLRKQDIVPLSHDNFVTDVQEVGTIRLLDSSDGEEEGHKRLRPAAPGCSIGHYLTTAGTFGALVRDQNSGKMLILSNNHVLANSSDGRDGRAHKGDPIYQPGPFDGGDEADMLARLETFAPLRREESHPACSFSANLSRILKIVPFLRKRGYQLRLVRIEEKGNLLDAALARPLNEEEVTEEVMGLGKVKGMDMARLGETVYKSGRTTGVTSGVVKVLEASVWVQVSHNSRVLMHEQIITGNMGKPGDSGSLVLNAENNAVGLLMAGSDVVTIMNKAAHIETLLKVRF
jgi:hypothetical protein